MRKTEIFLDLETIKDMVNHGLTKFDIADYYKCRVSTISNFLRAHNLKANRKDYPVSKITDEEIIKAVKDSSGVIYRAARKLNISRELLRNRYPRALYRNQLKKEKEEWLAKNVKFAEEN